MVYSTDGGLFDFGETRSAQRAAACPGSAPPPPPRSAPRCPGSGRRRRGGCAGAEPRRTPRSCATLDLNPSRVQQDGWVSGKFERSARALRALLPPIHADEQRPLPRAGRTRGRRRDPPPTGSPASRSAARPQGAVRGPAPPGGGSSAPSQLRVCRMGRVSVPPVRRWVRALAHGAHAESVPALSGSRKGLEDGAGGLRWAEPRSGADPGAPPASGRRWARVDGGVRGGADPASGKRANPQPRGWGGWSCARSGPALSLGAGAGPGRPVAVLTPSPAVSGPGSLGSVGMGARTLCEELAPPEQPGLRGAWAGGRGAQAQSETGAQSTKDDPRPTCPGLFWGAGTRP